MLSFDTPIQKLRSLALLEGLSFLLLLGLGMPLKYAAGIPILVQILGPIHGILFILYIAAVLQVTIERVWSVPRVLATLAAALVPFATFVLDRQLRNEDYDRA